MGLIATAKMTFKGLEIISKGAGLGLLGDSTTIVCSNYVNLANVYDNPLRLYKINTLVL